MVNIYEGYYPGTAKAPKELVLFDAMVAWERLQGLINTDFPSKASKKRSMDMNRDLCSCFDLGAVSDMIDEVVCEAQNSAGSIDQMAAFEYNGVWVIWPTQQQILEMDSGSWSIPTYCEGDFVAPNPSYFPLTRKGFLEAVWQCHSDIREQCADAQLPENGLVYSSCYPFPAGYNGMAGEVDYDMFWCLGMEQPEWEPAPWNQNQTWNQYFCQ